MLKLGSSAIGSIFFKGDIRPNFCPAKWKDRFIDGNKTPIEFMSEPMRNGSYFEYITGVNPGSEVTDIPNVKKSQANPEGIVPVAKKRLIVQKGTFLNQIHKCGIALGPDHVQKRLMMPWEPEGYRCPECNSKDITVINLNGGAYKDYARCTKCGAAGESTNFCVVRIEGTLDILTAFTYYDEFDKPVFYPLANIDVKTCGDIDSIFNEEFQWGQPQFRDHFQMDLYSYIFHWNFGVILPAFYMVFDWKDTENKKGEFHVGFKWVPHEVTAENHFTAKETVRKAIDVIKHEHKTGWQPKPSYEACSKCRIASSCPCPILNKNQSV